MVVKMLLAKQIKAPKVIYDFLAVSLTALLLCLFYGLLGSASASAAITNWVDSAGNDVPVSTTTWSNRLEFLGPNVIRDKTTGTYYLAGDLFDSRSEDYLRNGSGNYSDSNYWFIPVTKEGTQLVNIGDKCAGTISWHLHGDGSKSDLHLIQPELSGGFCKILVKDGETTFGTFGLGHKGEMAESRSYRIARLGEDSNTPNDWKGTQPHVRRAVSPLYWENKDLIKVFDSQVTFSEADGSLKDTMVAIWSGSVGGSVPGNRTDASAFRFWYTSSTDDQCKKIFLVTLANSVDDVYIVDSSAKKAADSGDNTVGGCFWNREVEGSSSDLINAKFPIAMGWPERGTKTAEELADEALESLYSGTNPIQDADEEVPDKSCASEGGALGWILCPILTVMDETTQFLENQIESFLFIDPSQFETGSELYQAWSVFRGLATVVIVIIALLMIFSQAMGSGVFDNYSVKKLLPRLLIAGIGIQLSWFLIVLLVGVFNTLGQGIGGLILSPFGDLSPDTNLRGLIFEIIQGDNAGTSDFFGTLVVAGVAGVALIGAIVPLALGVVAALFVGFITLIVRNMIVLLGVVLAPVGIAMSVLPGTQKTSKWWWESLEKALLMYPIVMALLSAGKVLGYLILLTAGNASEGEVKMMNVFAAIIAWYAPFFFLPKALQAGGAALGKISGFIGDKSKSLSSKGKDLVNAGKDRARNKIASNYTPGGSRFKNAAVRIGSGGFTRRATMRRSNADYANDAKKAQEEIFALSRLDPAKKTVQLVSLAGDRNVNVAQIAQKQLVAEGKINEIRQAREAGKINENAWTITRNTEFPALKSKALDLALDIDLTTEEGKRRLAKEMSSQSLDAIAGQDKTTLEYAKAATPGAYTYKKYDSATKKYVDTTENFDPSHQKALGQKARDIVSDPRIKSAIGSDAVKHLEDMDRQWPSDIRLKRSISLVGLKDGLALYKYQYLWNDTYYVGVMAQDLLETHPEAVSTDIYGYYHVDYSKLGIELLTYDQWLAKQKAKR